MKTSKEMQLKIIDKMRENVEKNLSAYKDIQRLDLADMWVGVYANSGMDFYNFLYRVKPEIITINGVEIPKPLKIEDIRDLDKETNYYIVCCSSTLYDTICIRYMNIHKPMFAYTTKEEAIEASKALFGIE